jgi:hypothetical protein
VRSSVPIPKATPQESRFERRLQDEMQIYLAADLLGLPGEEVVRLCKTGALRARCNRHGTWWIDKAFLVSWHEANPNYGAELLLAVSESADEERRAGSPPLPTPCPPGACESHWERRGIAVPAFRVSLCLACYSGAPLSVKRD